jgi:hypothetical protein
MRKLNLSFVLVAVILGLAVVPASSDGGKRRRFEANLKGIYEVGTGIGAVSTVASGSFRATLSEDGTTISYRLRYSDLEADITQSHIHVGQFHTAGGISVWLCQTLTNVSPTADTPMCPGPRSGSVEGMLTAANVIDPPGGAVGSGVAAGEFAELVRLMRAGVTYANVHSGKFPGGEIRGQIRED